MSSVRVVVEWTETIQCRSIMHVDEANAEDMALACVQADNYEPDMSLAFRSDFTVRKQKEV